MMMMMMMMMMMVMMMMSNLQRHEEREELPLIADEHAVAQTRQLFLHEILDRNRGDVLTPGRD